MSAPTYLMCIQVKGRTLRTDFRIYMDANTCQNEEDDGLVFATQKNQGVFQAKELERDFNGRMC